MLTPFSVIRRYMKIQQQYEELLKIKEDINEKLQELNFGKIKELMLWLAKSSIYQKLKTKENQLIWLERFCNIWLIEKKELISRDIDDDIFWGVNSLDSIEKKYLSIKFGILRLETPMPEEYYEQAIDTMIDYHISGLAIGYIIILESLKKEKNILKTARLLKDRGQLITAMELLQYGLKTYADNSDLLLELADCWMQGQQWQQAYDCLKKIKEPDGSVEEMIEELEKVVQHEKV